MKTAVIAIGGNSILHPDDEGTSEDQLNSIRKTVAHLVDLIQEGFEIVVTHGNGPQVGALLIQNDAGMDEVPAMPLDVCVAESQGQIGYLLQQAFNSQMHRRNMKHVAVSIVTQVVVNKDDPAFDNPTKYIGPYYTKKETDILVQEKGWDMKEDPRGGYRRVVPSPEPLYTVEKEAIRRLVFGADEYVVIAVGGGGIPVIEEDGRYIGVEAVIDKDLATSNLASSMKEELFIILTDIPHVCKDYGTPKETVLNGISLDGAKEMLKDGEFPPGSMGPKIRAAIKFLERGGEAVVITSPETIVEAIKGDGGTWITHDGKRRNV